MMFSAVILAGGQSRRMGCDKARIKLRGQSLLLRAVATARRAGAAEVFVSGRKEADYTDANCPVLLDTKPGLGPLGGIERALREMTSPLLLVLAVDLPYVTPAFLQKLASRCDAETGIVPRGQSSLEPLVAVYPKRCVVLVRDALAQGQLAACDFANACLQSGAVREFRVPPRDWVRLANWNSPTDLPVPGRRR